MKIVFNGREYQGLDQMPPEVRQQYLSLIKNFGGDSNNDGVPDLLESPSLVAEESIEYNGRIYHSRNELPPDVKALLDQMPPPDPKDIKSKFEVRTKVLRPQTE